MKYENLPVRSPIIAKLNPLKLNWRKPEGKVLSEDIKTDFWFQISVLDKSDRLIFIRMRGELIFMRIIGELIVIFMRVSNAFRDPAIYKTSMDLTLIWLILRWERCYKFSFISNFHSFSNSNIKWFEIYGPKTILVDQEARHVFRMLLRFLLPLSYDNFAATPRRGRKVGGRIWNNARAYRQCRTLENMERSTEE